MKHSHGLHHYFDKFRRKIASARGQSEVESWTDRFMYVIGIVAPLMTVPQITKIWYNREAQGVSAISWGAYAMGSFAWFIYGVVHKEKPIIFCNGVACLLQLMVVFGTLRFS